jgi:oligopeptide transport system substrate-binding protein
MKKNLLGLLSVILASTLLLSACSDKSKETNGNSSKAGTDKTDVKKDKDQNLTLIFLEPETLDSNAVADSSSATIVGATQEGLLVAKNTGTGVDEIVAAGAEKWETSTDGLTWTFHLRDYKWSDGKPVIAQHFVDSVLRLLQKENAFPYAFFGYDIKNGEAYNLGKAKAEEVGVKAINDKTVQFTLEKPVPFFLAKIAYPVFQPIRLDVIKAGGENWATDPTKQVYCGPYTIKEWVRNNSITMVKNPNYWNAQNIAIETVTMNDIPEFSTQAQLFENQQLDVTGSTQEYVEKWTKAAKEGKWQAFTGDTPDTAYLSLNQKNGGLSGIMSNAKIRKAVSLSFDREELIKVIYARYTPAYGMIPKSLTVGKDEYRKVVEEPLKTDVSKYKNNPTEIQKLVHEGLKELGKDTTNLKDIKLTYITTGSDALSKQKQEWWKQQLEKNLGVTIEMKVYGDTKIYSQDRKAWKFDICLLAWNGDYNDPMTFLDMWESTNPNNFASYNSPEYDKLLKSLGTITDTAKRLEVYKKLEAKLIQEDAAIAPVYYGDTKRFIQNCVKDFGFPMFGPSYEWRWTYISGRQ